jgi:hypothetical protein
MGPHAGIIREAARIAREAELGDRTSLDGMCVPDRHVSEILSNAFKKLSEQAIKDMYTTTRPSLPRTRPRSPPPRAPAHEAPSGWEAETDPQPGASLVPGSRVSLRWPTRAHVMMR